MLGPAQDFLSKQNGGVHIFFPYCGERAGITRLNGVRGEGIYGGKVRRDRNAGFFEETEELG